MVMWVQESPLQILISMTRVTIHWKNWVHLHTLRYKESPFAGSIQFFYRRMGQTPGTVHGTFTCSSLQVNMTGPLTETSKENLQSAIQQRSLRPRRQLTMSLQTLYLIPYMLQGRNSLFIYTNHLGII